MQSTDRCISCPDLIALCSCARLSGSLETSTNEAIQGLLNTASVKQPCAPPYGCHNATFVGAKIPSLLDQVHMAPRVEKLKL